MKNLNFQNNLSIIFYLLFGLVCLINGIISMTLAPIFQSKKGPIQGILQRIDDQNDVQLYLGIRYAISNRFQRPRETEPWTEIYNATYPRFACPQPEYSVSSILPTEIIEDTIHAQYSNEDCLYLNIWRPTNDSVMPRPILVWFYDDDYISGTIFSDQFDGRYLAYYGDIIVITVQYRLNTFGFLYGNNDSEPGNLATYDQISALKWIQSNAQSIGGDTSRVTIFGGKSVGLLLLIKDITNLFQRAILQSGPVFGPLGIDTEKEAIRKTRILGALVNCTDKKFKIAISCMQNLTINQLINATESMAQVGIIMKPMYKDDDDIFEISPVENLLTFRYNKKIDLLFGVNANESSPGIYGLFPNFSPDINQTIEIEDVFNAIRWIMQIGQVPYIDEVLQKYTQNLNDSSTQESLRNIILSLHSDINFVCPTILLGQQIARNTPRRQYYSYYLADTTSIASECTDWMGICYQQEISHIFGHAFIKWPSAEDEINLSRAMIDAWTKFAQTGNPGTFNGTVEWGQAWNGQNFNTMIIQTGNSRMQTNLFNDPCMEFWKDKMFALYRYDEMND